MNKVILYCVIPEFIDENKNVKNIIKVGKTSDNDNNRIKNYGNCQVLSTYLFEKHKYNEDTIESLLLKELKQNDHKQIYGNEYFEYDDTLHAHFVSFCNKFNGIVFSYRNIYGIYGDSFLKDIMFFGKDRVIILKKPDYVYNLNKFLISGVERICYICNVRNHSYDHKIDYYSTTFDENKKIYDEIFIEQSKSDFRAQISPL